MATRQECIDHAEEHARSASRMLDQIATALDARSASAKTLIETVPVGIAAAHAHAAAAQAWVAVYESQYGDEA